MRAFALGLLCTASLFGCGSDDGEPIPELLTVTDFTLVTQDGEELSSRSLRGKVWIADLIFTRCPEICPVLSSQMANLHRRIVDDDVRFISITVDPNADTPEVLRSYAERYRADTARWSFLTGAPEDVQRVITRSFRLPFETPYPIEGGEEGAYDILHTARFLLVDRRGVLRGMYETDREGLARLERDVERLLDAD